LQKLSRGAEGRNNPDNSRIAAAGAASIAQITTRLWSSKLACRPEEILINAITFSAITSKQKGKTILGMRLTQFDRINSDRQ
jgi:hypothetical protein